MCDVDTYDLGWLVGLLEGEGSFIFHQTPSHRQFTIQVVTCDRDVATRVATLLRANVRGPYMSARSTKPFYRVGMSRRAEVLEWCRKLRPLLSERRRGQIDKLYEADKANPIRPRGPRKQG
jgi:hypothetical protein